MVTLIGFFFILGNVGLLVLFVPDLIGPVSLPGTLVLSCSSTGVNLALLRALQNFLLEGDKSHG